MKPSVEQLGNLLALKRHERPEEGYWQDFLCEFHQRQRENSVKTSALVRMGSRMSDWFSQLGPAKFAYGAGLAYAALTVAFLLTPRDGGFERTPATPVKYEETPAPAVEQLDELDLSPSTQGSVGEQVF